MDSFQDGDLLDLNVINGLKELGGDDSFFKEIIELYVEQYPDLLDKIKSALSNGDFVNVSKSAHALKGASLNIGAKKLAEICLQIETNSSSEKSVCLDELLHNLEKYYEISVEEIRKL